MYDNRTFLSDLDLIRPSDIRHDLSTVRIRSNTETVPASNYDLDIGPSIPRRPNSFGRSWLVIQHRLLSTDGCGR